MKKLLLSVSLLIASNVLAKDYNGYIVKLKNNAKSLKLFNSAKTIQTSFGNFAVLEDDVSQKSLGLLELDPNVEYVEPNWIIELDTQAHNDKSIEALDDMFTKQWGLKNTGRNSGGFFSRGKAGEDVNAEKAWTITKGANDIVVAVIDTGIDYRHPDLQDNMWVNELEKNGEPNVDDDGNGYVDDIYGYDFANNDADPTDGHSHGTHCAGVIGATHNGRGVMGVMNHVKLMGVKFLSDSGRGDTAGAIKSVEYAMKNGAQIMSNSWGGGKFSQALKDAIIAANEKGIVFTAAAGNSNSDNDTRPTYPASYKVDNIIVVGAMDGKGKKASFSNYGKETVHVFAPGVNILSTVKNGGYKKMSGTSMATPMVSGVLGLLLANEPNLSMEEVKSRLLDTTVRGGSLGEYSQTGRVDAYRMLRSDNSQ